MIDIKDITAEKLQNEAFSKDVFAEGYGLVCFPTQKAKQFAEAIVKALSLDRVSALNELEEKYFVLVSQLRFSALDHYPERDIESFCERCMYDALAMEEFDIQSRIKAKLLVTPFLLPERDAFKKKLREAMTRNNQTVPSAPIQVAGKTLQSTIQNWFRDYFDKAGTEYVDTVQQAQYFFSSPNFGKLGETEKNKLKDLFRLYEWLKLSSTMLEGVEESIGYINDEGDLIDFQQGVPVRYPVLSANKPSHKFEIRTPREVQHTNAGLSSSVTPEDLVKKAKGVLLDAYSTEQDLKKKFGDDPVKIKRELVGALKAKDANRTVACLLALARLKRLADALKQSESWRATVASYAVRKYADQNAGVFIEANPISPEAVSEFLQYLLVDRLEYTEEEAAIVAMELGDIMDGEYNLMAYADETAGMFAWVEHEVKDGKLVAKME